VRAYKFLAPGAVGVFSGFHWPQPTGGAPGSWVEAGGGTQRCRRGIHACRVSDLPWWLGPELWEAELDGTIVDYAHKVAAPRGRLLRRIEDWTAQVRCEYVHACAWRARARALEAIDGDGARRLRTCTTLDAMQSTARELADSTPSARIALTMAADGAATAIGELPAMGAYVAAHAARVAGGAAAIDAERRWQADWLAERLGLSAPRA
jgi:hypothetical protein